MQRYTRLFIDFDGVICDSVAEAYYCSFLAYHQLPLGDDPLTADPAIRERFIQYRPFIRSGQHLVLLQRCIEDGVPLTCQDDFESQLAATTETQLAEWRKRLYAVREQLIAEAHDRFVGLSTLYPEVSRLLPSLCGMDKITILSTKRNDIIQMILRANNIHWPDERVISVNKQGKIDAIREYRAGGNDPVYFIDDHLPHILDAEQSRQSNIDCYLADWGYTLPEWRSDPRYQHVDTAGFAALVSTQS